MILDPVLIYGWLGLPALGVYSAAYATVLGQITSLILAAIFHFSKNTEIKIEPAYMKPSVQIIKEIYAFGLRDAITPIVSFNYGKQDKSRINSGIKYGLGYTFVIMLIGTLFLEIFAEPFGALFGLAGSTKEI